MTTSVTPPTPSAPLVYLEYDGKPMADNSKQARWLVLLYGNLCALFGNRDDVFVGLNQSWFPVQTEPDLKRSQRSNIFFGACREFPTRCPSRRPDSILEAGPERAGYGNTALHIAPRLGGVPWALPDHA